MSNTIIYEHPLNERVRTLLRLEHLFKQAQHFLGGESPWDSRTSILTMMEILDIFSRGDLRTELLKDLERTQTSLAGLLEVPGVDSNRLRTVLEALHQVADSLHNIKGQLGQELRDDPLLTPIRQRITIPGGTCDFDLPAYHRWLAQPAELRHKDLARWFSLLDPVRHAVELLLKLLRNSAEAERIEAKDGVYQRNVTSPAALQMVRLALSSTAPYYPEVSGGKHRFNIRFLTPGQARGEAVCETVAFNLSCCNL